MILNNYFRTKVFRLCAFGLMAAGTSALLCSCAPIPVEGQSPTIKSIEQYESARSFDNRQGIWPTEQWWKKYNDPQLDELVDEALRNSPTMTIAEARLRYAQSISQLAGSSLKPQISADASASSQKLSYYYTLPDYLTPRGTHGYASMALDFSWELDFWGKNRATLSAATSQQAAAEADLAQARLILASSVAAEYGELARLYAVSDSVSAIARVQKKSVELFGKRYQHGLETEATVELAKSRLATTEEELISLERQIGLQKNRLAALLGAGPDRGLAIGRPSTKQAISTDLPANLPVNLLGRRPDIVASRLRVEASESLIERQKAEFYPNINLSAFIGYQAMGLDRIFKNGADFYGVAPAISLPIFTGGRLSAQLEGARASRDEAIGTYNDTVTQALKEVNDAAVNRKHLSGQIAKINASHAAAAKAHQIISNRYRGGLANYLEVLNAEETLLNTEVAQSNLNSQVFLLDVALVKALGGGYSETTQNRTDTTETDKDVNK